MVRIPKMTPSTLSTILKSAPLVIQGASKLIDLIREQASKNSSANTEQQLTLESLQADIDRLESRLASVDDSNIEQIKLIEQLARQNEVLAESLNKTHIRLRWIMIVAILALLLAIATTMWL